MEKEHTKEKDAAEHKPIDPGRAAARESRTPGKPYEPQRSESPSKRKDDEGHEKH